MPQPRRASGCRFRSGETEMAFAGSAERLWRPPAGVEAEDAFWDRLSEQESFALSNYMTQRHEDVNGYLRLGFVPPLPFAMSEEQAQDWACLIDNALARSPLAGQPAGWRGFQSPELWQAARASKLIGSIFQDDGFSSLGLEPESVCYYACGGALGGWPAERHPWRSLERGLSPDQVLAHVVLDPKRCPLVVLTSNQEPEMILRRGSCFRVEAAETRGATLHLELVHLGIPRAELELRRAQQAQIDREL